MGTYCYDASNTENFVGFSSKKFDVADEFKEYKIVLPIENTDRSNCTAGFRPVLAVPPDSQIEYSSLRVSLVPREANHKP